MESLPDNPNEYREQARYFSDLCRKAASADDKEHFAALANGWLRLAGEIEGAQTFLHVLNQLEFEEPKYFDEREYPHAA